MIYPKIISVPQDTIKPVIGPVIQDTSPFVPTPFLTPDTVASPSQAGRPDTIKPIKKVIKKPVKDTLAQPPAGIKTDVKGLIADDLAGNQKDTLSIDSLLPADIAIHISYDSSIFSPHLLHPEKIEPLPRPEAKNDWVLGVILLALLLVAAVRIFHFKKFRQYFDAFFAERMYFQLLREERTLLSPVSLMLTAAGTLIFALFFYQCAMEYGLNFSEDTGLNFFLILVGALIAGVTLKLIIYRITGFIFKTRREVSDYIFTIFLFINVISIFFIPLVIGIEYLEKVNSRIFVFSGLVLMLFSFLYRNLRGITVANSGGGVSKLYLFFYLCALEILPLVVLIKVLSLIK